MKEIQNIRTTEQMQIYVDKIKDYITSDDIQGILAYQKGVNNGRTRRGKKKNKFIRLY